MELTHQDVLAILEMLERSNVEYLEVEIGGTRLVADKSGLGAAHRETALRVPATVPAPAPAPVPAPAPPAVEVAAPAAPPAAARPATDAGLVTVTAPVVGVFYRAHEPGAAPFVEVGTVVDEGTTLALVEVMKMLNSVTAPVRGEVLELLAQNGDFVEFGQPLMVIRPEARA
jgi:acetyl-CoA carboxylase biotin carboxyl carrier protein